MDRTVEEVLDALVDGGEMPTELEVVALCRIAEAVEATQAKYEALEQALRRVGLHIIDTTTDDDEGTTLEIVPFGEDDDTPG